MKTVTSGRARLAGIIAGALLMLFAAPAIAQDGLDTGDTAWMLTATLLVLMMTIPGLALFYGGMVRKKHTLSMVMQSFAIACLATIVWMVAGYSLAFTDGGGANAVVGGLGNLFLWNLSADAMSGTIPETVFMTFQMTFAIITPALITGSLADRMKFSTLLVFVAVWIIVVYAPITHWVWGGGFLAEEGVLDFAGGTVVHINAGVSGLVAALIVGKRHGYARVHGAA
jgi:Amt family ammonium transporter